MQRLFPPLHQPEFRYDSSIMPELPDIELYIHALRPRVLNQVLTRVRVISPFLVRTVEPAPEQAPGRRVVDLRRLGKRIVLELAAQGRDAPAAPSLQNAVGSAAAPEPLFLVFHLMIAGRLRWLAPAARPLRRSTLAWLEFPGGTLAITEAAAKKRAALHVVRGEAALASLDPGGLEVLAAELPAFNAALRRENHTLKRALTDPRLFAGIGNAYSDEILHAADLSPLTMTGRVTDEQAERLYHAARRLLEEWTRRLLEKFRDPATGELRFPAAGEVTAFRPEFAVHGRFGQPCPVCRTPVQRIRYAETETNYCPKCQTGGRVLADRSLSRLLREDWPRAIEELERGRP